MRIVRSPDGIVRADPSGKAAGRGAYVCMSEECLAAARKRDALAKALKVKIDDSLYDELLEMIVLQKERREHRE
jgi:hypothetical protein